MKLAPTQKGELLEWLQHPEETPLWWNRFIGYYCPAGFTNPEAMLTSAYRSWLLDRSKSGDIKALSKIKDIAVVKPDPNWRAAAKNYQWSQRYQQYSSYLFERATDIDNRIVFDIFRERFKIIAKLYERAQLLLEISTTFPVTNVNDLRTAAQALTLLAGLTDSTLNQYLETSGVLEGLMDKKNEE